MVLCGLGRILSDKPGSEQQAQKHLDDGEKLFRDLGEPRSLAMIYIAKSYLLAKRRRYRQAEAYLQVAIERLREIKNPYLLGEALSALCKLYYDQAVEGGEEARQERFARLNQIWQEVPGGVIEGLGELFSIHYSRMQGLLGRAWLQQGRSEQGMKLLCRATETGLSYNKYVSDASVSSETSASPS
mgnify:CR=1 FL=1